MLFVRHDLQQAGWLEYVDVPTLSELRTASASLRTATHGHLIAAMVRLALAPADESLHCGGSYGALAAEALACIAAREDAPAVARCLGGASPRVRKAALVGLRRVADRGDLATEAVLAQVLQGGEGARAAALLALGHVARRNQSGAVTLAVSCLSDGCLEVRMQAIDALERIAGRGDAQAIFAVVQCLAHNAAEVRETALIALERITEKGDVLAVAVVATKLRELADGARAQAVAPAALQATASAMQQLCSVGDAEAMSALALLLEVPSEEVRMSAVTALGTVAASTGDARVTAALSLRLCDDRPGVRLAAVVAMEKVASKCKPPADQVGTSGCDVGRLLSALSSSDSDERVRAAAVLATGRLSQCGDAEAARAVAACLADEAVRVRTAAVEAFKRTHGRGRGVPAALAVLRGTLHHTRDDVREAALAALEQVVEDGDHAGIAAAIGHLADVSALVRLRALTILGRIAPPDAPDAVFAIAACLDDPDAEVRDAAAETLRRSGGRFVGSPVLAARRSRAEGVTTRGSRPASALRRRASARTRLGLGAHRLARVASSPVLNREQRALELS